MTAPDEGGEAPCFAHLLDDPSQRSDESLAGPVEASSTLKQPAASSQVPAAEPSERNVGTFDPTGVPELTLESLA
jgi:hypothetical protein